VADLGDRKLQLQLLDRVAETSDREIKGGLLNKLASLETHADELVRAARESAEFATALARALDATTPAKGGVLEIFAARIAAGIEPQRAAGEVLEISKNS
jgi:hypothetical protein